MKKALLAILLVLSLGSSVSFAADWRDWRGHSRQDSYRYNYGRHYGYRHGHDRFDRQHPYYWHRYDRGRPWYHRYSDRPYWRR
jgi:hypothetical protein